MKSNRRRKPLRADWWDYSLSAGYFLTLCTKDREHHFGYIANGKMNLSEIGVIARHRWQDIPHYFPFSSLGEFVIMPDHIHGISSWTTLWGTTR
ncbi:MAG: hypothetical protein H6555_08325 [Lewinellaceae bacterium]|nr:hypothetical protein [Lewinellaceae bacterium]